MGGVGGGGGTSFTHVLHPALTVRSVPSPAKSLAFGVLPCQSGSSAKDPHPGCEPHATAAAVTHACMLATDALLAKLQPPLRSSAGSASVAPQWPLAPGQRPEWHV